MTDIRGHNIWYVQLNMSNTLYPANVQTRFKAGMLKSKQMGKIFVFQFYSTKTKNDVSVARTILCTKIERFRIFYFRIKGLEHSHLRSSISATNLRINMN